MNGEQLRRRAKRWRAARCACERSPHGPQVAALAAHRCAHIRCGQCNGNRNAGAQIETESTSAIIELQTPLFVSSPTLYSHVSKRTPVSAASGGQRNALHRQRAQMARKEGEERARPESTTPLYSTLSASTCEHLRAPLGPDSLVAAQMCSRKVHRQTREQRPARVRAHVCAADKWRSGPTCALQLRTRGSGGPRWE